MQFLYLGFIRTKYALLFETKSSYVSFKLGCAGLGEGGKVRAVEGGAKSMYYYSLTQ